MTRRTAVAAVPALLALALAPAAAAHGAPDEGRAAWVMADWMLWAFLLFFGAAFVAFLVFWKLGLFRNLEAQKYPMLAIEEPDYYTPEWAREEAGR